MKKKRGNVLIYIFLSWGTKCCAWTGLDGNNATAIKSQTTEIHQDAVQGMDCKVVDAKSGRLLLPEVPSAHCPVLLAVK